MKLIKLFFLIILLPLALRAQQPDLKLVYTSDIDHFWQAYDSVATTTDTLKQVSLIQRLYVDRGTLGLKAFMKARDYNAHLWVKLIQAYPKFWKSIRANTLSVKGQVPDIVKSIVKLKKLYPEMRPARMYFTVGGLRSGGTTTEDMVLVGTEIATGDPHTDASELGEWLLNVFKEQQPADLIRINIHEYVHTQQKSASEMLLSQVIHEGAADFIAEMANGKKYSSAYMIYGRAHEKELKEKFRIEMFSNANGNWLYNGSNNPHPDLGYYMGYAICQGYYDHQKDKRRAIKTIIELDYSNEEQVISFLKESDYFQEPINKQELLQAFEKLQPQVISISPNINGQKDVPSTITEISINFSEPMAKGYSISYGEGGKEHFPISGVVGFTDDRKSFKLKLNIQPGNKYDFMITDRSFKSERGYPLKPYNVYFEVK